MDTRHRVSIIVSDLEAHTSLPRLLQSISRQSTGLNETEIVIAGNGQHSPSDVSIWQAIVGTDDIRLFNAPSDASSSQVRNSAAAETDGELLLFLRPDYRLDPKFLVTIFTVLEDHPGVDIIYPDYIRLAPRKDRSAKPSIIQLPNFQEELLQTRGFLGPATMLTRQAWDSTIGFRDNTAYREWDLWVQAALAGNEFFHVNYPLASCEHRKVSFRQRAEDGRYKAMIVINNQPFFHMHTVRWALAYLRGEAWAEGFGFMTIPDPMDVTRMLSDHAMKVMGTDSLAAEAVRQFDRAVINTDMIYR